MRNPILYFGERWAAPVLDDGAEQVPTPVGLRCVDCDGVVVEGDRGFIRPFARKVIGGELAATPEPVHAECDLRGVMGHTLGLCSCTGHGPSRRTARLIWAAVGELRGRPLEDVARG